MACPPGDEEEDGDDEGAGALWRGGQLALSFNYSINQSAKEALYTPTSQEARYKAKAFIDMFVQRAAKVRAVGINLGREFRARAEEPVAAAG